MSRAPDHFDAEVAELVRVLRGYGVSREAQLAELREAEVG